MAARLVGLLASCGDEFRSQLLAADTLQMLVDVLEATEAPPPVVQRAKGKRRIPQHTVS